MTTHPHHRPPTSPAHWEEEAKPRPRKMLYIGGSITHNIDWDALGKVTNSTIRRKKAYGSTYASSQRFPESNFEDVVPSELRKDNYDILVMQASSTDLTNLPENASRGLQSASARISSRNMVRIATEAARNNPNLKWVILMERIPRYDEKTELNEYANRILHETNQEPNYPASDKVFIGRHELKCEGKLREDRYGIPWSPEQRLPRHRCGDGIHMRGTTGKADYTRSVCQIISQIIEKPM